MMIATIRDTMAVTTTMHTDAVMMAMVRSSFDMSSIFSDVMSVQRNGINIAYGSLGDQ
jgi:hypothetical protein